MPGETENAPAGPMGARSPSDDATAVVHTPVVATTAANPKQSQETVWVVAKPVKTKGAHKRSISPEKAQPRYQKKAMPKHYGEAMYAFYHGKPKTAEPTETDTASKEQNQVPAEEDEYVVLSSDDVQKEAGEDAEEIDGFVVVPEDPVAASPQIQLLRRFAARFM